MNSKDKAFLKKFCVKESSNLISPENFRATGLSMMGGLEMTRLPPPQPNFYILPIKSSLPPIVTWNGTLKTNN